MDEITQIILKLHNSGFHQVAVDPVARKIYMEDPSCIARTFETFLHYAWITVCVLAGVMMLGWAISLIRGVKNNLFINLRNLMFIFVILAAIKPILGVIYGSNDVISHACTIMEADLDTVLDMHKQQERNMRPTDGTYEILDIQDSGLELYLDDSEMAE